MPKRGQQEALAAIDAIVGYYRTNANRMKYRLYRLYREHGFPIGSGAVESTYHTAGALRFYGAIRRAHWATLTHSGARRRARNQFRYARYGTRDMDRCAAN